VKSLIANLHRLAGPRGRRPSRAALLVAAALASACTGSAAPKPPADAAKPTATYDQQNGKLSQLDFDRDGDGKIDTRAYMDGVLVKSIEIDRDGSGKPDRWEYYEPVVNGVVPAGSPDGHSVITRAEESNRKGKIDRREFYENGVIARIEEDTDGDGRPDKWEQYRGGLLVMVDLDLHHRGRPERRLVYRPDGTLDHLEADPDGDGNFKPIAAKSEDEPAKPRGKPGSPTRKGGR
jgi:hypothetical protein